MAKKRNFRLGYDPATQIQLHLMMLPGTILIILFNIVPLFGLLLAFKNYKVTDGIAGIFTSPWYGFQNFKIIFANHDFGRMMVNTLGINLIGQLITIPLTIGLALMMNEIRNVKFRYAVQTVTYMPHFISWVVFGGIIMNLLSTDGAINAVMMKIGIIHSPITFMANPNYFWTITIVSNLVKEVGWGTILYTAAIAGVSQELYEAASLDGAGRFRKMWYITLPSIKGTIVIMLIFAVAGIMNNNFDQIYVLQNSFNIEKSEVIDTYIYRVGLQNLQFGMAAAINVFKSALALMLLLIANKVSNKLTDSGLF
ncbi:ABC transporter permease subunit [Anthropogastromicrobium sp.]|uniref:ABC transporter permease n=1 Tax=Anthropogastromicrobium sp. TaxID=2981649 RepID=UPI00307A7589